MKRNITFNAKAFAEFIDWGRVDSKVRKRIESLIVEMLRDPFQGIGKPEPLKGNLAGCWSRRINDEHRLVYRVTDAAIEIVQCRGHY